jgi:type I restriction enzyme S subunit
MSWQECSLEMLIDLHDHRRIPLSGVEREKRQGEFRYYGAQGVIDHIDAYIFDGEYVLVAEDGENLRSRKQPIAQIASGQFWVNNHAHILQAKEGVSNNAFICALLNWIDISPFVTGAAQPKLSQGSLKTIKVRAPDAGTQLQIATVLSAYDDLIATNQRRIALLEDAARRLYREWFVHLRFPGYESVPVKDGVPEGWAKLPLGDVAEITMGQSPESKYYNTDGDGLPFHQGVSDFGHRFVKHETYTKQATRIGEAGDILCSVRAPVGRLNLTRDKIAIGRGLSTMRSRAGHQSLLFYQLDALFVEEDMIGGGAIFASVGKKELFGQLILQPSTSIATTFNRLAADLDTQIENLNLQNQELAQARDLLLPKLMSGQLDVSGIRIPDEAAA